MGSRGRLSGGGNPARATTLISESERQVSNKISQFIVPPFDTKTKKAGTTWGLEWLVFCVNNSKKTAWASHKLCKLSIYPYSLAPGSGKLSRDLRLLREHQTPGTLALDSGTPARLVFLPFINYLS